MLRRFSLDVGHLSADQDILRTTRLADKQYSDNNSSETRAEPEKPRIKSIKRRKSVTFTGETKQNDGNSAESGVEPIIASNLGESAGPSSETTEPDEPISKKTKKSKDKSNAASENLNSSEQSTKAKTSVSSDLNTAPIPEYVRYLELFHHDKKSWKFNKNHQTALLKNIFDLHKIPSTLTTAVIGYVSGLKGASPRQRLAKDAKAILKSFAEKDGSLDEIVEMNTESARREAYFKAMHKAIEKWEAAGMPRSQYDDEQIEDMEMEMERGKRAEAVLRALPLIEPSTQSSTPSTRPATLEASPAASTSRTNTSPDTSMTSTSQSKRTSRKRKQRTDVSSNSSSSSSDSSSDSSDDETNTPPKPTHKEPQTVSQALRGPPAPPKVPAVRTPAYQHDNLNMSYRPQNPSQLMNMSAKPTKKFFDDELLDAAFPKKKTYHETAPKRRKVDGEGKQRARGFAYTHGTKVDESGSEDEG